LSDWFNELMGKMKNIFKKFFKKKKNKYGTVSSPNNTLVKSSTSIKRINGDSIQLKETI